MKLVENPKWIAYCKANNIPLAIYESYKAYCTWMIPRIDGREWQDFHYYVMDRIDYYLKQGSGILILELPQRTGKTLLAGWLLVTYYLGMHPDLSVLYTTNTSGRAIEFTKEDIYPIMFSDKYKKAFPTIKLKYELDKQENTQSVKEKRKSATLLEDRFSVLNRQGQYNARGVDQAINGIKAHLLINDDPFANYNDANSETIRNKTLKWYTGDFHGRSEAKCLKILISTRYHDEDVIGYVVKNAKRIKEDYPDYPMPEVITFRAEAEIDNEFPYDSRSRGEFLIPEFKNKYLEIKYSDPITWACVYQQQPINVNGLLLKLDNFKEYNYHIEHNNVYISIDTNLKAEATKGDCCGITVWELSYPHKYLIEFFNERYHFQQIIECILLLISKYPNYRCILIETKASGGALYDILSGKFHGVVAIDPTRSKMERLQWCLPEFHAGNVFLPVPHLYPQIMDYKRQLLNFTGEKNNKDDLVDSTTMFLNYVRMNMVLSASSDKFIEYKDNNRLPLLRSNTNYFRGNNQWQRR